MHLCGKHNFDPIRKPIEILKVLSSNKVPKFLDGKVSSHSPECSDRDAKILAELMEVVDEFKTVVEIWSKIGYSLLKLTTH